MTFDELLTQVYDLLQCQGRLSYRALKARFQMDDDLLEALKDELIYAQRVAADEDGRVVVWMGERASTPSSSPAPAGAQERAPLSYTPAHLAAKIRLSRSALEGERKQVTVLFADLKGSMELLAGRTQEAVQLAGRALDLSRAHKERRHEAWALRLLGELAARQDPPEIEPAAQHYRQALALAEELGMRPLMAHCRLGLGRLYDQSGQREQASAELSTAIAMYRTMEMTFWLPQAEVALAQVAER